MKIKLQDYSLISNEWIDETIKTTTENRDKCGNGTSEWYDYNGRIWFLNYIKKEQLIPSEKLADKSFHEGSWAMQDSDPYEECKQKFLTSEIEIL